MLFLNMLQILHGGSNWCFFISYHRGNTSQLSNLQKCEEINCFNAADLSASHKQHGLLVLVYILTRWNTQYSPLLIAKWWSWEYEHVSVKLTPPTILIAVKYAVESQQSPLSSLPPHYVHITPLCFPGHYRRCLLSCHIKNPGYCHRDKQEQQWTLKGNIPKVMVTKSLTLDIYCGYILWDYGKECCIRFLLLSFKYLPWHVLHILTTA